MRRWVAMVENLVVNGWATAMEGVAVVKWVTQETEWAAYYNNTLYCSLAKEHPPSNKRPSPTYWHNFVYEVKVYSSECPP